MNQTPFHSYHLEHGGKMVDFAGWDMPLHYGSIAEEHKQCRTGAVMFDVSHMGRVKFTGRSARRLLERLCTRKLSDMAVGSCRYSFVCNATGGILDDVIVYRFDDHWLMVVNASNREKLLAHFAANVGDLAAKFEDMTMSTGMIALQGPRVMEMIGRFSREIPGLKRYQFATKNLLIVKLTISRTGYTGEDGVEVILPAKMTGMALKLFLSQAGDVNLVPAGLAARDSLRLEAGMPLYGHELGEDINPIATGFNFAISLDKDQDTTHGEPEKFIGQDALKAVAAAGPKRKLVGLKVNSRRTPRQGFKVKSADGAAVIGDITSGCLSPTLGYPIAMAYLDSARTAVGTQVSIDFGSTVEPAEVVKLPFYKHP